MTDTTSRRFSDDGGNEPRFVSVSRRAFLRRAAIGGAGFAVIGVACTPSDEQVFADASGGTVDAPSMSEAASTTAPTTDPDTAAEATSEATTVTTEAATTTSASDAGAALAPGSEVIIAFTYAPSGSGRVLNPYVAVWVENESGDLVDTISLWFQQGRNGARWLDDLRSWYSASGRGSDTTMSGATRGAGSYTVAWDGTDLVGAPVSAGTFTVYIETAREHGPRSLTSAEIVLDGSAQTVSIPDDGEIASSSATVVG